MTIHKVTGNGIVWRLDADDKREEGTDSDFMMGNGHFILYGDNPMAMDAEMARCMSIKKTIIH
jgi:hypothetical protein